MTEQIQVKAVIFDLDGVICFTDKYHYAAWKELADSLNIEFNEKINNRLRGVSRLESLEIILENYDKKLSDAEKHSLAEQKNMRYRLLLDNLSPNDVSPEILETLKTLKKNGFKMAIGSSSKNAGTILNKLGLTDLFDAVSDGNNITRSKPDPEVFIKAAQMLNQKPCDCAVVEDASAGIDAANSGGFISIGIGDASTYQPSARKIDSLNRLCELLIL